MKCTICKHGDTQEGFATVTLQHEELTLVVKKVPARICQNCGEEYVDEAIARQLFETATTAARSGAEVEVRHYLKAA